MFKNNAYYFPHHKSGTRNPPHRFCRLRCLTSFGRAFLGFSGQLVSSHVSQRMAGSSCIHPSTVQTFYHHIWYWHVINCIFITLQFWGNRLLIHPGPEAFGVCELRCNHSLCCLILLSDYLMPLCLGIRQPLTFSPFSVFRSGFLYALSNALMWWLLGVWKDSGGPTITTCFFFCQNKLEINTTRLLYVIHTHGALATDQTWLQLLHFIIVVRDKLFFWVYRRKRGLCPISKRKHQTCGVFGLIWPSTTALVEKLSCFGSRRIWRKRRVVVSLLENRLNTTACESFLRI